MVIIRDAETTGAADGLCLLLGEAQGLQQAFVSGGEVSPRLEGFLAESRFVDELVAVLVAEFPTMDCRRREFRVAKGWGVFPPGFTCVRCGRSVCLTNGLDVIYTCHANLFRLAMLVAWLGIFLPGRLLLFLVEF